MMRPNSQQFTFPHQSCFASFSSTHGQHKRTSACSWSCKQSCSTKEHSEYVKLYELSLLRIFCWPPKWKSDKHTFYSHSCSEFCIPVPFFQEAELALDLLLPGKIWPFGWKKKMQGNVDQMNYMILFTENERNSCVELQKVPFLVLKVSQMICLCPFAFFLSPVFGAGHYSHSSCITDCATEDCRVSGPSWFLRFKNFIWLA